MKRDQESPPPPPLCVYCSSPWTDDMIAVYGQAEIDWGYYGEVDGIELVGNIDVTCSTCKRLVYRKEIRQPLDR